jgi:hypothetical protein
MCSSVAIFSMVKSIYSVIQYICKFYHLKTDVISKIIIDQLFMHCAFLLYTVQGLVWMTIWLAGLFWENLVQVSKIIPYSWLFSGTCIV